MVFEYSFEKYSCCARAFSNCGFFQDADYEFELKINNQKNMGWFQYGGPKWTYILNLDESLDISFNGS